ncbi:MAG TPA: nucleotidyltransferase family protein [Longimicrobium sp.]|nr:nucleotidyltransferase family protein [Longimicrobium sp.]
MDTTTRHLARDEVVRLIRAQEEKLKRDFGVRTISLFGSVARDEAAPGSDVDVLVEFEKATFAGYMGLKFFLEELLGTSVDVATPGSLRPRVRASVLREALLVA